MSENEPRQESWLQNIGWTIGLVPAFLLLGLQVCNLLGIQIPGQFFGTDTQVLLTLALTLLFAAAYPVLWWRGYRHGGETVQENQIIESTESNRKLREARYQSEQRAKELNTALERLKSKSEEASRLNVDARRSGTMWTAMVNASNEALILTDVHGIIRAITNPAAILCGIHHNDALGQAFDSMVNLFDASRERPQDHPIKRIPLSAIDSADAAPKLDNAELLSRSGKTRDVLVTSMAILDREGTAVGAYIKLETEDEISEFGGTGIARMHAGIDPVTGLLGRDAFRRSAETLIRSAHQAGGPHQLIFVAPDNLDFVVDRYGYQAGEQLLWQLGDALTQTITDTGECFQVSGSRLAVLLADCDAEAARDAAEHFQQICQQITLSWRDEHIDLPATAAVLQIDASSAGVMAMLELAEGMLRAGRRAGGSRVYTGMPSTAKSDQRFSDQGWVDWLEQRLEAGLGHLLSQEIRPLAEGSTEKSLVEIYVRVEDTDGVWISPKEYLPALRRCGQTALVDLWVLEQVLRQIKQKADVAERFGVFSLNVAAESVSDQFFCGAIVERLTRVGVSAQHLCFEILENTATSHAREVAHFVREMQKLGARIAIDQCRGVGLQRLLRDIKPDYIKLDPGLVRHCAEDPLNRAQTRWLVQSSKLVNAQTIACGVEDPQLTEVLLQLDVDFAQGSGINKIGPLVV